MLTLRFAIDGAHRDEAIAAMRARLLPPLAYRKGVAGVHLGLADEAASNVETAERKVRGDATAVPSWVLLIEGNAVPDVVAAADELMPSLATYGAKAPERAIYRLEFTRLKTPWSAG